MVDMPRFKNMAVYTQLHMVSYVLTWVLYCCLYMLIFLPQSQSLLLLWFIMEKVLQHLTPYTLLRPIESLMHLTTFPFVSLHWYEIVPVLVLVSGFWVLWTRNKWSQLLLLLFILLVYISLIQFSAFFLAVKVSVTISCTCSIGVYFVCLGKLEFYCPERHNRTKNPQGAYSLIHAVLGQKQKNEQQK